MAGRVQLVPKDLVVILELGLKRTIGISFFVAFVCLG